MPADSDLHFLTIRDVAERLKLSRSSIYQLVEAGKLAHHRVGTGQGAIRISQADLVAFLKECRQGKVEKPAQRQTSRTKLKHIRL